MSKVLSVQQETGLSSTINSFKSMETFTFFIGIDISKATLDWAVVVANKLLFHYQSNDKKGIESFVKHLKQQCSEASFANSLYCMEHTGIYNNHILSLLQVSKASIWVEHPIHIKESLGMIRGKNDKIDAQRIALYAYKNREEVQLWTPKREVIQKLDGWPLPSVDGYPQSTGQSA